ncbi:MAG: hypothetical protein ACXAE3_09855, partial [Candidatus Kariarchaeaceae archaeon]
AQLNYLRFILSKREGETDSSFATPIYEGEMTPYEIGHHAASALWDNALRFDPDGPEIAPLGVAESDLGTHLLDIYEKAIHRFDETVSKLDDASLAEIIQSPVSGREVEKRAWFWTTVMHSVHHFGQAFRIQGIVHRH